MVSSQGMDTTCGASRVGAASCDVRSAGLCGIPRTFPQGGVEAEKSDPQGATVGLRSAGSSGKARGTDVPCSEPDRLHVRGWGWGGATASCPGGWSPERVQA